MWLRDEEGDLINCTYIRRLVAYPTGDGAVVEAELSPTESFIIYRSSDYPDCERFLTDMEGVLNGTDRPPES